MQNLCIGQPVWFNKYTEMVYEPYGLEHSEGGFSQFERLPRANDCEHTWGVVSGIAIRYGGIHQSYREIYNVSEDSDVGNYLAKPKRYLFWEVRTGMASKPVLVSDEDLNLSYLLNLCKRYPSLPLIGRKVKAKKTNEIRTDKQA